MCAGTTGDPEMNSGLRQNTDRLIELVSTSPGITCSRN